MNGMTDRELIIRIKSGEIDEFAILVKKYMPVIHSYVNKKLFNKHDVDDIVQNSFVNFYKAIGRFDADKPVLPYLFEITRNELKMYYRSRKLTVPLDDRLAVPPDDSRYRDFEIDKLIDKLPSDQQKALKLTAEGYSYEEISKLLKKPLNTVRTIIRRGRLKIVQLSTNENA